MTLFYSLCKIISRLEYLKKNSKAIKRNLNDLDLHYDFYGAMDILSEQRIITHTRNLLFGSAKIFTSYSLHFSMFYSTK